MKPIAKVLLAVGAVAGAGTIVYFATRKSAPARPVAIDPSTITAELLGSAVEPGYTTYGWYGYTGASAVKFYIRVDRGADDEGTVLTTVPWRWTVFVDKPAPEGLVPIATGEKSWDEMRSLEWLTPVPDEVWHSYNDEGMGQAVANLGAEQIDAMVGGE